MIAIGIDPSLSSTGLVVGLDGKPAAWCQIQPSAKGKSKEERIYQICKTIRRFIVLQQPDFTIIEGYSFASVRSNSATTLHELGGAIRQVFHRLEIPWHEVPPTTLKAFAGHGKASKEEMMTWAKELWPDCPNQNDVADAFWCMRYATANYANLVTKVV